MAIEGDKLPDEKLETIEEYRRVLGQWHAEGAGTNAEVVESLKEARLRLAKNIVEGGLAGHPRLGKSIEADGKEFAVDDYLAADFAEIARPDPRDSNYADFVRRKEAFREQLVGGGHMVGAESWAEATGKIAETFRQRSHVEEQYELLRVRGELAREHWDDPAFTASVAIREKLAGSDEDNKLTDELLRDFDYGAGSKEGRKTSAALAGFFVGVIENRGEAEGDGTAASTRHFLRMQAAGDRIRHDHSALIAFAKRSHTGDTVETDSTSFNMGLAALEGTKYSNGLFREWHENLPEDEKSKSGNTVLSVFSTSRRDFERRFEAGDPEAARSFAIMEHAAGMLLGPHGKVTSLPKKMTDPEDRAALLMFSQEHREQVRDDLDAEVGKRVTDAVSPVSGDDGVSARREGQAAKEGDDAYAVDLGEAGKGAYVEVIDGGHVMVSNSKEDFEAGKGVSLPIAGLAAPPPGTMTKNDRFDAGEDSKAHLQELLGSVRKADGSPDLDRVGMEIVETRTGGKAMRLRLNSGEDVAHRMIRDGYGVPVKDVEGSIRGEHLAKQAESRTRGLWRQGFPEMDDSWRSERDGPMLTAAERRGEVVALAGLAMAGTPGDVERKLSQKETRLFALPVSEWSAGPAVDRSVRKMVDRNPARAMEIYGENMEILGDLRKRKDKLSGDEKLAHDRLSLGRRALAEALVDGGFMTEQQAKKDSHPLMSRKSINMGMEKLRPVGDLMLKGADAVGKGAKEAGKAGSRTIMSMLDEAME